MFQGRMALKASPADLSKFRDEEVENARFWKKFQGCLRVYFQRRDDFSSFGMTFHAMNAYKSGLLADLTGKFTNEHGVSCVKLSALLQDDQDLYDWLKKVRTKDDITKRRLDQLKVEGIIGSYSGRRTQATEYIDVGDGSKNVPEDWCAASGPVTRSAAASYSSSSFASSVSAPSASLSSSSSSSSSSQPTLPVALEVVFKAIDLESKVNTAEGPKKPTSAVPSDTSGLFPFSITTTLPVYHTTLSISFPSSFFLPSIPPSFLYSPSIPSF